MHPLTKNDGYELDRITKQIGIQKTIILQNYENFFVISSTYLLISNNNLILLEKI